MKNIDSNQTSTMIDDLASSLGYVKSYRCTFCKRGFCNAQALGGHMNIHRRDRAKLREFSDENLLSLDIGQSADSPVDNNSFSNEKLKIGKAGHDHDHGKVDGDGDVDLVPGFKRNPLSLTLFPEAMMPSERGDDRERATVGGGFEKHLEESDGGVDLELRLGLEPHAYDANTKP